MIFETSDGFLPLPFGSFRPTHYAPLCKLKAENGKDGKLKKKDWDDI